MRPEDRVVNNYRVFDQSPQGLEVALRDVSGRFHIARTSANVPNVGTELAGVLPHAGRGTLLAAENGQMFRVTFELVDCSLQTTFDRLHPAL
jgi:hypothetical protein